MTTPYERRFVEWPVGLFAQVLFDCVGRSRDGGKRFPSVTGGDPGRGGNEKEGDPCMFGAFARKTKVSVTAAGNGMRVVSSRGRFFLLESFFRRSDFRVFYFDFPISPSVYRN